MKKLFIILLIFATSVSAGWVTENDLNVNRYSHIKTAAIVYGLGGSDARLGIAQFIAERHDLAINPSGEAPNTSWLSPSAIDTLRKYNDSIRIIKYTLMTSIRSDDIDTLDWWATEFGYDTDSIFMWVEDDSVYLFSAQADCNDADDTIKLGAGDTLSFCVWGSHRYVGDFRHLDCSQYFIWKAARWFRDYFEDPTEPDIHGIFEDEAHYYQGGYHMMFPFLSASGDFDSHWEQGDASYIKGYDGYTWAMANDSLRRIKIDTLTGDGWMADLMDTMYSENLALFANITVYGRIDNPTRDEAMSVEHAGMGIVVFENQLSPIVYSPVFGEAAWEYMDSIISWDTGYAVIWNTIFESEVTSLGSLERCQLERQVFYLLGANPERFYFMIAGNSATHLPNGWNPIDTLGWKWWDAIAFDVGTPDGPRYLWIDTIDGDGQTAEIRRRDNTRSDGRNVMFLYRGKMESSGTAYGNSSAIKVGLGGNYQVINADASLGSVVDSVDIRHIEGVMLLGEEVVSETPSNLLKDITIKGVTIK